jgi:NhaP-type Na+/H+ and K+/H+ antiporter
MTIELTIKITPDELQELEKNMSELIALILKQKNTNIIVQGNEAGKVIADMQKTKDKQAVEEARRTALETNHQVLAEIIRNARDLKTVKQQAKSKTSLKRHEIAQLSTDKKWLRKHKLPSLPEDDDVFRMNAKDFKTEVINHFKQRLTGNAENGEYLEIYFYEQNASGVEYRNWCANILKDIANGKKYEVSEDRLFNTINGILMTYVQNLQSTLQEENAWTIIVDSEYAMIVIAPDGAKHILAN